MARSCDWPDILLHFGFAPNASVYCGVSATSICLILACRIGTMTEDRRSLCGPELVSHPAAAGPASA